MIFHFIFVVFGILFYKLIIKPLIPLILLKIQLGKQVYIWFYPFWGPLKYHKQSQIENGDFFGKLKEICRSNPEAKIIASNLMDKTFLMFLDAEYIKKMYLEHNNFKKFNLLFFDDLLDKGLLMTEGEQWKHQRNQLGVAFTFEKLKARIPMINDVVKNRCTEDPKISSFDFISWITGEVVIKSFFGNLCESYNLNGKPAQVEIVQLFGDIVHQRFHSPYTNLKLLLLFGNKGWKIFSSKREASIVKRVDELRNSIRILIEQRVQQLREKKDIQEEDMYFLDIILIEYLKQEKEDKNYKQKIEEIVQQFITLFFTGTDTTSTMSVTCLVYLAQNQEAQQELLDEIITVVGNGDVKDVHLNKLVRMNAFIQEVFRLKNPAFSPFYRQPKQDMQLLDVKLKKEWIVVQRHDIPEIRHKHYQNPTEFNYKQWLDNNPILNDNGYVHVPFGAGPRNCIGQHMAQMELKIILSHILRQFHISINPNVKVRFGMKFLQGPEPDNCIVYQKRK